MVIVRLLPSRLYFFFFFSSRRRHTRYIGDWSSDVCSSDLARALPGAEEPGAGECPRGLREDLGRDRELLVGPALEAGVAQRSEERRVGKECRGRRWQEQQKKRRDRRQRCDAITQAGCEQRD